MPIAIETASEPWRPVNPEGVGMAILVVGYSFSILSALVVSLRIYVRVTIHCFGLDDWFMCFGLLFGLLHNASAIWGAVSGLGSLDPVLTVEQGLEADKAILVWEIAVAFTFSFVKASICCALMRLAVQRSYRTVLWISIVSTLLMNIVELVASLLAYNPNTELCTTGPESSCFNYTSAGYVGAQFTVYILVDATCTILPIFLLWNLQMSTRAKVSTAILLGLGSLATIASIIRLPLTLRFNYTTDRLYHRGRVIIWTVVEINLGIIAGSMPAIRKLFRWVAEDISGMRKSPPRVSQDNQYSLVNIRKMMRRDGPTRLRTPNEQEMALGHRDQEDLRLSHRSGHLENRTQDLKGFTTVSHTDTTTTSGLSRHETVISGGS